MNKIKLYKYLINNPEVSQRKLAEYLNFSVGTINSLIKTGLNKNELIINQISYRKKEYIVTQKGREACNRTGSIKTAVILAAGKENEFDFPRSFLQFGNQGLLERHINLLIRNNITDIYVIAGQDVDRYRDLQKIYNFKLIINEVYSSTGTLYSLSLLRNILNEDFLILEGDIIYDNLALRFILNDSALNSTIITELSDRTDSVYVNIENTVLTRISKDKFSMGNINGEYIGISKVSVFFFKEMMMEMDRNSNPLYFYEYAIEKIAKSHKITCLLIHGLLWAEVDDKKQYSKAKKIYKKIKEKEDD